jgi:hypothetical protein
MAKKKSISMDGVKYFFVIIIKKRVNIELIAARVYVPRLENVEKRIRRVNVC